MAGRLNAADRKWIAKELTAALIALYLKGKSAALTKLDKQLEAELTPKQRKRIQRFAAERAALIVAGTNQYINNAAKYDVPKGYTAAELTAAEAARQQKAGQHNREVLIPFLIAWAMNNALVDTYQEQDAATTNRDGEPQLWQWSQNSDFVDDCTEADSASPDTLDNLMAIGGGIPPVHENCLCTLEPV